jgi:serine/threonine protein phosphatase 1
MMEATNPIGQEIEKPDTGRRLVIPDVHGCYYTLLALMEKINLAPDDQLFFLGDYVNKGPHNRKVLEYIFELQKQHESLYLLRGNHEQMYLDCLANYSDMLIPYTAELKALDLLEDGQMHPSYIDFFKSLLYYFELPDYWLVHAGFNFNVDYPFADTESMLNIRDYPYNATAAKNKPIVHGHNPKSFETISEAISKHASILPLDNGCPYTDRPGQGQLLCFNLDTRELMIQKNIDG